MYRSVEYCTTNVENSIDVGEAGTLKIQRSGSKYDKAIVIARSPPMRFIEEKWDVHLHNWAVRVAFGVGLPLSRTFWMRGQVFRPGSARNTHPSKNRILIEKLHVPREISRIHFYSRDSPRDVISASKHNAGKTPKLALSLCY